MTHVTTIDCHYLDEANFAAAYLLQERERAAFIETNTAHAVPRLLGALDAAGLTPAQVDHVIVTHVHLDHAGGASTLMQACPNATLLCHPRAHPHLVDPSKLVASAKKVYGEERFRALYGEIHPIPVERTRIVADDEVLTWGERELRFLHTRGHANHHMCILDAASNSVFTGDAFGLVYPALQDRGRVAVPSTSPTDFDADAARESLKRIVNSGATRAYLTHFGGVDDLRAIAAALDAQLARYGAIVRDALDGGPVHAVELDTFCAARVQNIFDDVLGAAGLTDNAEARALLATDIDLNAQGIAFAVRKARVKAARNR